MTTEIILFGNAIRGDFFLVILLLFLVTATIVVVTLLRKGRRKTSKTELETLLSNPEVIKALNSGNEGLTQLIKYLESRDQQRQKEDALITTISTKIINDIEWDVAGLLGVGVTIVLLFMVVSGTSAQTPEQLFTGWLLILGYYFGKGARK